MSCLLEEVAAIGNPSEIVQWLCPHLCPGRGHGSPIPGTGSTQLAGDWHQTTSLLLTRGRKEIFVLQKHLHNLSLMQLLLSFIEPSSV